MRFSALVLALVLSISLVSAVYPNDPGFRGCAILNDDGQFGDIDCDRVPDIIDNCPLVTNPEQSDMDVNGLGDLCDLVIDQVSVEPSEPMQGRSAIVHVGLFNNRPYPMRNMIVKIEVPKLGLVASEQLRTIQPGERIVEDLLVRIPQCAPLTFTDVVAIAEYPVAPGKKEVFSRGVRVPVIASGLCGDSAQLTVVDITELQDVLPESGATYPFTIKNNYPESKAYVLSVTGASEWGNVIIEPGSLIVVPSGGVREGRLYVYGYPDVSGMKSFILTVQSREDIQQVLLQADVKQPVSVPSGPAQGEQLLYGILAFLAVLVLIAIVLTFMRHKSRQKLHNQLEREAHGTDEKYSPRRKKATKK